MQKNKAGAVIGNAVFEGEVKEVTLSGTGHPNVWGRAFQAEGTGNAKTSSYSVVGMTPFRLEFVHTGLVLSFSFYFVLWLHSRTIGPLKVASTFDPAKCSSPGFAQFLAHSR